MKEIHEKFYYQQDEMKLYMELTDKKINSKVNKFLRNIFYILNL
jgi:hypothetical protein